jgi:hypothetical protein
MGVGLHSDDLFAHILSSTQNRRSNYRSAAITRTAIAISRAVAVITLQHPLAKSVP